MKRNILLILSIWLLFTSLAKSPYTVQIAVLKYKGGGDWYANPSSLTNLALFCNDNLKTAIDPKYQTVEPGSIDLFNYPFVHMTGHGNVFFDAAELRNLRTYLKAGGFLHIDDNYGMDQYIRPILRDLFSEHTLQKLSTSHAIFQQRYNFPEGLPKIHQHDQKPPSAEGIIIDGRLALLYTTECDLGDGWEDEAVHNDPAERRLKALQMGANIIQYALSAKP